VRARVLLLATQAGLLGLSVVFLVVPASAVFLDRYGADDLPFVYLAVAVLGVVLSRVVGHLQARLPLASVAQWCIGAFVVIVAASWALLQLGDQSWVSAVLVGLFPLSIPVGFVLIGTQAGRLLNVRSMKQYFARIVAGFSLGFVVGGLGAAVLTGPLGGPVNLLLVDVVTGLAYLASAVVAGRKYPEELGQRPEPHLPPAQPTHAEPPDTRRNGLFVVMFGYQLLAAAITQLLDYIVWERAAFHFPDPSDLARFQGLYGTALNIVALAFVFLVAGRLLVRYGERGGLAANPLGVVVLLVVGTVVGVVSGADGTAFFVVMCAQQVAHISLTDGLTRAAINTAYQALEPQSRLRAQTVVEAAGVPLAVGFVAVLLLVFRVADLDVRAVVAVTLVLTVAWLVTALIAYRHYRSGVLALVTARPWEPRDLVDSDDEVVMSLLASSDVRDVRVGLGAVRPAHLAPAAEVAELLAAPDPYARLAATCEVIAGGGERAREAADLWAAALADPEPRVRDAALVGCAAAPDRFYVPHLLGRVTASPPSSALADALARHAAELTPSVVERLANEHSEVARERLIWALGTMRDSLPEAPGGLPDLRAEVDAHTTRAARAASAAAMFSDDPTLATLHRALVEDVEHSAQTLADHLAMHHGHRRVDRIVASLGQTGTDQRALAIELLEVLVGRELGERIAGLLAPWAGSGDVATIVEGHDGPELSAAAWVGDLAADPQAHWRDPWLRACAVQAAPTVLAPREAMDLVRPWVDDDDAVVAETAQWAVSVLSRP
jgi:HEAT repeat protein